MNGARIRRYGLPMLLGFLGVLLLFRVFLGDAFVMVPEDGDVLVLVALLGLAMIAAIHTIVRISMTHLRLRSMRQVRSETLAEHRRFLSRLDHELKNPLTALRAGHKTLLLTALTEQQVQIVATMETETARLSRLVTELRKLAELETQPLNLQSIGVESFISTIVASEQERFAAGQLRLLSTVEGAQAVWRLDDDLLAVAIHNLLDNAFKYSPPLSTVQLAVSAGQELIIQVIDQGIGIPPDALPHIWEELYRAPQLAKIAGNGIGLALVRAIVEHHNGIIDIQSAVGQGTTVTLRLPAGSS